MGIVVEFPAVLSVRRAGPDANITLRAESATIMILPVIRIERYADDTSGGVGPEKTAPGRRRKRRARS